MLELVRRTRILLLVSVLVLSVFIYFVIYSPMMSQLQNSIYLNVSEVSLSKYSSIQNAIQGSVIGSVSLSSRSAIRDKIADYKNGNATLDELNSFTQPKYKDGAAVLDNIVFAQRIVDGQAVATYQDPSFTKEELESEDGYSHIVSREFLRRDGELYLKVFSPVTLDDQELGYDIVLFDFTNKLLSQNDPTYTVQIANKDDFRSLQDGATVLFSSNDAALLSKNNIIYYAKTIDGHYFLVQAERKVIFADATSLGIRIAVSWMIVFVGILLAVYFYIIRYANKTLKHTEQSRDLFKSMAYTDKLTGLYSRAYLDVWKTKWRRSGRQYSLIMMDIDDFKRINDQFGHLAGDQMLKRVADIFIDSVREDDIIVRYGGDEYLLILSGASADQSRALIERIGEKLAQIQDFGFPLSVSSGVSELGPESDFNTALKLADQRMYADKTQKDTHPR